MTTNLVNILPRIPIYCFWEITDACNLRCIHCEADAGVRSPDELSTDEAFSLIDSLKKAGCENVMLTGGEPLVRKDWPRLARRLADLELNPTIITNGILVDENMISRMIDSGVTAVSVSLDGDREVHDSIRVAPRPTTVSSYDRAIHAIEISCASELKTAVITQIHKRNIDDLPRMHEQMIALGVDMWQVQICMPLGRLLKLKHEYLIDPSDIPALTRTLAGFVEDGGVNLAVADNIGYYDEYEPILRGSLQDRHSFWTGCKAGCRVVAICADGEIKGCPSHPRSFAVGNIRQTPFAEIWKDSSRFSYNTEWREDLLEGECAKCPFRRLCRAGCTSMAFSVTGTIYDNPFCVQRVNKGKKQR